MINENNNIVLFIFLLGVYDDMYILTISCQQKNKFVAKDNLDDVLIWLKTAIDSFKILKPYVSYETSGRYNQLHYHAVIDVHANVYYKPFTTYGCIETHNLTFRVQWTRIYDLQGACAYVIKDTHGSQYKQEGIIILNYYKHHRFDIDTQTFIAQR